MKNNNNKKDQITTSATSEVLNLDPGPYKKGFTDPLVINQVRCLQYDAPQEEDYHTSHNFCKVEIPASEISSNFATRICESLKITHSQASDIS